MESISSKKNQEKPYKKVEPSTDNLTYDPQLVVEHSKNLSDKFICVMCLNIVIDPRQCEKCSNLICRNCFLILKEKNNTTFCPLKCNFSIQDKEINRMIKQFLNAIEIKCVNSDKGCKKIVTYENYIKHYKECEFNNLYMCNYCQYKEKLNEIVYHCDMCNMKPVKCELCNLAVLKVNINDHKANCSYRQVKCELCFKKMTKFDFDNHNRQECGKAIINYYESELNKLKDEYEKKLQLNLKENNNSIFQNIISSGTLDNNVRINQQDLTKKFRNEYFGDIISDQNLDNWIVIEFFDIVKLNGLIIGLSNQSKEILLKLLTIKISLDGRTWSELGFQAISQNDQMHFSFSSFEAAKYLLLRARSAPIIINYLKILDQSIDSSDDTSINQKIIDKTIFKENDDELNFIEEFMKDANNNSVSQEININNFNNYNKFINCKTSANVIGQFNLEDISTLNVETGLCLQEPADLILELNKELDFNEIEIAGIIRNDYSKENSWKGEDGAISIVYTSTDGENWLEVSILPLSYSENKMKVKLLRSKAKFIRFTNNLKFGLSYLSILPVNLTYYLEENLTCFNDFSFSGPFSVDEKEIMGDNNLSSLSNALLVQGFCCNKPGYLLLELKENKRFNEIDIGGFGGNTDAWHPSHGKRAEIYISETGFLDSWRYIKCIPYNYTNDIIKICLDKIYEAKFIKIISHNDLLGVAFLDLIENE